MTRHRTGSRSGSRRLSTFYSVSSSSYSLALLCAVCVAVVPLYVVSVVTVNLMTVVTVNLTVVTVTPRGVIVTLTAVIVTLTAVTVAVTVMTVTATAMTETRHFTDRATRFQRSAIFDNFGSKSVRRKHSMLITLTEIMFL